ncbi:hypothetical protein SEUBUCD650_0M01560 [Saccharomyces eubayanus]|uniref:HTH APSES-type domain-containing protein n=1 Tax=Saccharomyces eubayanus TaxID=1080349 RepID=A0ABN8VK87_SACEU|nr:hypothetical protein SEUBUCD650_0M01560 [Saccharomyces eubayanus]
MPTSNQININDIQPNRMLSESNMRVINNNEHTIGQSAQQQQQQPQQQQQQYLSQGVQPLVPVSYQYVVPEQWPYPQYYQQSQPQPQSQQQQQPQMCQVQESYQRNSSDSNGSNPSSTSVAISSAVSGAALSNASGPAIGGNSNSNNSNSNSSSNVPYYYYFPQMQAPQSMAYSYPQAYYYYPANSDGTTNPNGIASSVTNIQNQNSDTEKNYSAFELQQQQQLQAQSYPSQAPKISNVFSKSHKSGPPSDTSTGSISPSSNRTSRNSNGAVSLTQQLPMPNYPKPSTYQFPGFHKTSSISNSHSPIPPRPLTTPTQVPVISQKDTVNYNHPQMGLLPQQQVSPLYDGNSITPPVKTMTDQEAYLTVNRQGKTDQQYDPMAKAMNSFQTTTIRHPMPVIAAANDPSGSNTGSANIIRPRVTTTMWEDEKTLCYQVEANGISVVRRADNDMINGTKLLNVTKMTRGRRDGILKAEKIRHVVKIGSMHLKGVWIPFERALAIAQREKIADYLYPLFIKDIQSVLKQNNISNDSTSSSSSAAGIKSISPRTYYQPIDNYQGANAPTTASAAQLAYSSMNLNNKSVHNNPISTVTAIAAGQRPMSQYPIPNMNQTDVFTMANAQNLSTTMPMKQQDSRIVSPLSYPRNTVISPVSRLGNTSSASRVFTLSPHTTSTNQASETNVGSLHTGITLPRVGSESESRSEGSEETDGNDKVADNENTKESRSSQLPISALTSTHTGTGTTSTSQDIAHSNEPTEIEPVKEQASFKSQAGNPEGVFKKVTTTNDIKKQE